jgi:hypothetical protein
VPKINVYLNEEDKAFMQERNISPSKELQHRLSEIRSGSHATAASRGRRSFILRRMKVRSNRVRLKPGQQAVGYDKNDEGIIEAVYVLDPE